MKKLLPLLFLFLSLINYAQVQPGMQLPYTVCDDASNDGFAVFNLTSRISSILSGVNASEHEVHFYPSDTDAVNGTNEITTPTAYINSSQSLQVIGIKIVNTTTNLIVFSGMNLVVNTLPTATISGTSTVCQNSASPIITFTGINGITPYTFTFLSDGILSSISTTGTNATVIVALSSALAGTQVYSLVSVQSGAPGACSQNLSGSATVTVIPTPIANPAILTFCDPNELPFYNLSTADTQITGAATTSIVSYYETLANAQTNSNSIANGYVPLINPGNQTLFAKVTNPVLGCSSITTLTLQTQNCNGCLTPTALVSSTITFNSVFLNWTENGTATNWHIVALPIGSPAPTAGTTGFVSATTNQFVLTGLNPFTSYDIYVRADCGTEVSSWSDVTTIVTEIAPPVCGGNFVDQGGITANYPNNSNFTTTLCPTAPGDAVTVTFTSFNTEPTWDALYVYNGAAAIPSQLIPSSFATGNVPGGVPGGYWGNSIPGPFLSSDPSGCLTFVFRSDPSNALEGWIANVTCTPAPICETPTALTVSAATNTSAVLNWTHPSVASQFEVLIVPQGSPEPTANSFGVLTQNSSPYIATGLIPNQCYTAYLRTRCVIPSEWSSPVTFCMSNCENNGSCAESLALIAFLDSNNNGIKDIGEVNFNHGSFVYQINDSEVDLYGSTIFQDSYYIFDSNPTNSYDISFAVNPNLNTYYTSSVLSNNITLPTGSGVTTLYFPVVNILPHVDSSINLYPTGQPRPGFTYSNIITYQNNGFQTIPSGTITFTKASNVSVSYISQAGTTTTSNGFTYDFTNLAPFETRTIYVTLVTPTIPTVSLGDLVINTATIQINNDIDTSNNISTLTQTIIGSYDPNDKSESHGGKIVFEDFTSNDYLYYTIQFENTGTASAEFIRIEDLLDAQLDETTFEMINASHNVNTRRNGNQLTWHFYDIDLPPTVTNPAESHGYVYFKIKPKSGYAIGDIIPNFASIYFDYNPPIITESFNTEFVQALGTPTFNSTTISLYPNPTNSKINIINNGIGKISKVAIYEISGKRIYTMNENTLDTIAIDVSHFAKGIYLIELTSDTNSKIIKKLILK
jgi:hypothetical protein